ncbi:MAG: GNAT family N-acetyltransferase [Chloroflexi bacterium]|nr:GNAT family N-acetyltransferase [Chloroflexota bacterium]
MPIRSYTGDQLPSLLDFIGAVRGWGSQGRDLARRIYREVLAQPDLSPSDNCFLLEDEEGKIQGFCLVTPELPISRTVLELEVAPHLSGSSLEVELLRRGTERARELGARVVHICPLEAQRLADLLSAESFVHARTYLDLVWDHAELPLWQAPDGFSVRSFQPGDASLLTEIQNSAFDGSWGFCPNSVDQIEYRASLSNTSHQGIIFLHQGENPAGYCWTCVAPVNGGIRGLIGMIGVVPGYRGQGVSRAILLAGMEHLRSIGVADIALQVDGSNTPAIRLYTSVGFEKVGEFHWFELDLELPSTPNC